MAASLSRPPVWDICEEHLDEAAWLWGEWEASLDSAVYSLAEVAAGPEERLLAHLDGLVLGGVDVAEGLLVPSLASDEPGLVAAATWTLVEAEDADHQDKVFEALASAVPPVRAAMVRALGLSGRTDISRLIPLWEKGAPAVRAAVMELFSPREPGWVRERVQAALRSGNLALVSAAVRAVRDARDEIFKDHLQLAMQIEDPAVWRLAISAGLMLGSKLSREICRAVADTQGPAGRFALGLLASSSEPADRASVRAKLANPELMVDAIWALGFSGEVESADLILQSMERAGQVAGEAFSAITGIVIDGAFRKPGQPIGPDDDELAIDAPPPELRSENDLPEPALAAVQAWWAKERGRFNPGVRYLYGQPRSEASLRAALLNGPTWRREVFVVEAALSKIDLPTLSLQGWAKDQIKRLLSG